MRKPQTVRAAEDLGRVRLSANFFMRDFLYSDIANFHGFVNLPDNPDLAIASGKQFCEQLLEPLQAVFGRLEIRSAYRSPEVNHYGNVHYSSTGANERQQARHIWDQRDDNGNMGAMATVVVPWLVDRLDKGLNWQSMAWWIHDHLPYSEMAFFPKLAAFNLSWHEAPKKRILSYTKPLGLLTKPGFDNFAGSHADLYPGYPKPAWLHPISDEAAMDRDSLAEVEQED
jgi:hypothetical protein